MTSPAKCAKEECQWAGCMPACCPGFEGDLKYHTLMPLVKSVWKVCAIFKAIKGLALSLGSNKSLLIPWLSCLWTVLKHRGFQVRR
jgi:hypothetical protein